MLPRYTDGRISSVWIDVLRSESSSVIRTHLQFCYRAHDRVSQPRDAEFLQVSCFGFEEIAAVGRDSPIFPPFAKCCLAEYWRAGITEKLNQITKWGWTAYFFTFISIVYTWGKQNSTLFEIPGSEISYCLHSGLDSIINCIALGKWISLFPYLKM